MFDKMPNRECVWRLFCQSVVRPKPMAQSASLWRLFCQFGSQRQQSSMGFPVRHAGWLSFAWRDSICLRVIEALALLQKQNKKKKKDISPLKSNAIF